MSQDFAAPQIAIELAGYRDRYRRELMECAAFWQRHSLDPEFGGQFTCLDREGAVYDTRKYVWLQGRAVWMFSRLYNRVEARPEWLDAARRIARFVRQHAFDDEGRCYFSLERDGRPASFQRKPYGAVFVTMGLLEYSKAAADREAREEAASLFWRILEWIEHPALLGRPAFPDQPASSKLADVMVTMMMALELVAADGDLRYEDLLRSTISAAMRHLDPQTGVFLEQATLERGGTRDSPDTRFFNPGHSVEMAWFLLHALRRIPDASLEDKVLGVLEASLDRGWDREYGGLFYFMDIEGKPMLPLEAPMKLWWPHTEAIYAAVLAFGRTRDRRWLKWLARLDEYAWDRFRDGEFGEWFGYCDRAGRVTNTCKGNHYKGFFHLPRFLLFSGEEMDSWRDSDAGAAGARELERD